MEEPNEDPLEEPNEYPLEDPNEYPMDEPNEDPIDEQNEDPIDDQNVEGPNVGVQPSVVVSYTWYVNLANTSVHLSLDIISPPFMICTALWSDRTKWWQ